MKKKKDGDKPVEKDDPHRQIQPVVEGEAADIFDWLEGLFTLSSKDTPPGQPKSELDAMPERIALHAVARGGRDRGQAIDDEEWRPTSSPLPSREMLVKLANKFVGRAQKHCNTHGVKQRYCLFAFSNLKGSDAYSQWPFALSPVGRDFDKDMLRFPPLPAEEENSQRLLQQAMAHTEWAVGKMSEMLTTVLDRQNQLMTQLMTGNKELVTEHRQLFDEHRKTLLAFDEAKAKSRWEDIKADALQQGIKMLAPIAQAVPIYLSKGKPDAQGAIIAKSIRDFIGTLSEEQHVKLIGRWEEGGCVEDGILDKDQVALLDAIAGEKIDPKRITDFMKSLQPEQMMAAQQILEQEQIMALIALNKVTESARSS